MNKQTLLSAVLLCGLVNAVPAAEFQGPEARAADIGWLIDQIETRYVYLPERHLDLAKMRAIYVPEAQAARTRDEMIHVVERVVAELHDDHVTLGTNTPSSPQLIPTGAELWAQMRDGKATIVQVLPGSPAAKAGIAAGDVVVSIGGIEIDQAIAKAKAKTLTAPDAEATDFALRTLLAGTHDAARRIAVKKPGGPKEKTDFRVIDLAPFVSPDNPQRVTWRWLDGGTGYIRIENSLGDSDTMPAFDEALKNLEKARNIILDLRNTPSGGSTDIAEPIMGRFITQTSGYQRIFEPGEGKQFPKDSWVKTVEPRAPAVSAGLVVLVDHWTGSMGEGMAIGFDAMKRARIVGTPMARLRGGTENFELPRTGIPVHLPTYRLYHLDGSPRETFVPAVEVDLTRANPVGDPILERALATLH